VSVPVVHVVDDDEPLRTALERMLRARGYEVRTYASAGDFLLTPPAGGAGCLVLDVRMPGPSGLELQQALEGRSETLPIIFVSGHADVPSSVRAMKAGAVDFLTKPVAPEALLQAVATALDRDRAARAAREAVAAARTRYGALTERERAVFDGAVAGRLNKQIAADLGIAESTVKAHRGQVMEKMGAGSIAELVQTADLLRAAGVLAAQPGSRN
jgi:FixJ family two-component response regulator